MICHKNKNKTIGHPYLLYKGHCSATQLPITYIPRVLLFLMYVHVSMLYISFGNYTVYSEYLYVYRVCSVEKEGKAVQLGYFG